MFFFFLKKGPVHLKLSSNYTRNEFTGSGNTVWLVMSLGEGEKTYELNPSGREEYRLLSVPWHCLDQKLRNSQDAQKPLKSVPSVRCM